MPRDSHLLPEHSQQILAKARSGRTYKPPAPPEEDKEAMDEEEEHKEVRQGFTIRKWVKVPRHLEEPEPEYLAKRRKGLPSQYSMNGAAVAQPTPMRETKVKKTDAEGNVNVYKVLVPEGQAVEGEVQLADVITDATVPAPGTVVEGVGVVNAEGVVVANDLLQSTPPRRRPPPPKKKKRSGPGRGRKKVLFVEGATEQGTPISSTGSELLTVPGLKQEGSVEPSEGGDTPMPDAADEDEGSAEEGSDDEDQDDHEPVAHTPTPTRTTLSPGTFDQAQSNHDHSTEHATNDTAKSEDVTLPIVAQTNVSNEVSLPEADVADVADVAVVDNPSPSQTPGQQPNQEELPRETLKSPEPATTIVTHSRHNSTDQIPPVTSPQPFTSNVASIGESAVPISEDPSKSPTSDAKKSPKVITDTRSPDGEPDLLGSLERQLEQDSGSMDTA